LLLKPFSASKNKKGKKVFSKIEEFSHAAACLSSSKFRQNLRTFRYVMKRKDKVITEVLKIYIVLRGHQTLNVQNFSLDPKCLNC
jgi:hypothetical protein